MWHPFNYLPRSWRIPALAILFALTVIAAYKTHQTLNIFPINALELAPSVDAAKVIIDGWKKVDPNLDAAHLLQYRDNFFILCYSTFLALGCFIVADWLYASEATANFHGKLFAWLMWVAGILDYVENHAINKMLDGPVVDPWPTVSSISASIKFTLIGTGSVYILSSLFVRLFRRKLLSGTTRE
jgi:small-conductance mechanosensitive channel